MHVDLVSDATLAFCLKVRELARNAYSQTTDMKAAAVEIKSYVTNIKSANRDETETYLKMLIAAFAKVTYKLTCLVKKMNTLNYVSSQCEAGTNTVEYLFTEAQKQMVHDSKACVDNGYMVKSQVVTYVADTMKANGKEVDCILNSATKKKLVCGSYVRDISDIDNAKANGVTLPQAQWFIKRCPPATVTSQTTNSICANKNLDKTLPQVLVIYSKYNPTQVETAYNGCPKPPLTSAAKTLLCTRKDSGYTLPQIIKMKEFQKFDSAEITKEFNKCPKAQMKPDEIIMICKFKMYGFPLSNDMFFGDYKKKYGVAAVTTEYNNCGKKRKDAGIKNEFYRYIFIWRF